MKILKIVLLSILSIFVAIYLAFLFILPNMVDLNQYSPQITKAIQDATGFKVQVSGLKVKTAWNLSAGALIDKTDLSYPTGTKFAQINNLQVRLSLLPMAIGKITVDNISIGKIMLNIDVKKDGKFLIEDYLPKNQLQSPQRLAFKFSDNMPDISAKNYRISFVDLQSGKKYSVKGSDFKVFDFILNKRVRLKTNGELILNGRKQIAYKLAVSSKVFAQPQTHKSADINIIKMFDDLYKYNLQANINADIKMTGKPDDTRMDGKISLDKITLSMNGTPFPPSNIYLDFNGDKIKINSNIYADSDCKATINGIIKNGKRKYVDLHVKSDKIELGHGISIANTFLKTLGKNDLEGISANGILKANFELKSDFKKIESNGFLNIANANIYLKPYKTSVNAINADVDFSQDEIKIKQASAKFDSQPLTLTGTIDKNANANIKILASNLPLKGLLISSGNAALLKDNDMLGSVNLNASLKGRLDKATPSANIVISNILVKNRPSKTQIKLVKATIKVLAGRKINGEIQLTALKSNQNGSELASAPLINMIFDDKNLLIKKTYLYVSGIKTNLEGRISNLNSSPRLNSITVSIPNQTTMGIAGYPGSQISLKGNIILSGNPENPQIQGGFFIPSIHIPSMSLNIKDSQLTLDKEFSINCPQIHIANSSMSFSSQISKDFSKGLVLKNANFISGNLDLDSLAKATSGASQGSSSALGITISNGKTSIARFKTGNIIATNISSGLALRSNILYLDNLDAKAYNGEIKGNINYNVLNGKTNLNVQGRGLSANSALTALTGQNDHVAGVMDFDSNISMKGATEREILTSLNGDTGFIISNGQMGTLGKFEHLLYAQNILSNNVFKGTLNIIAKAITVKNTGVYKYMKGKMSFSNGWANIAWIKTSGPAMSLYLTGRYYLPDNTANLTILGRISDDVVRILGPIGEFSMDKAISSIPKIGEITAFFVSQFTVNPNYEDIDLIPDLSPKTEFDTKEFKVVIDGDAQKQNAVKSFKWISRPTVAQQARTQPITTTEIKQQYQSTLNQAQSTVKGYQDNVKQQYEEVKKQIPTSIPDFVNKLPNLLN